MFRENHISDEEIIKVLEQCELHTLFEKMPFGLDSMVAGTNKKLAIKVPSKKLSVYKKYFKGKGNTKITVKKVS